MIGNLFTIAIGAESSGTAAKTLIRVTAASTSVTLIERMWIKQSSQDTSENLAMKLQEASAAGTTTTVVPEPKQQGDTFGGTAGHNATAEPTYTGLAWHEDGFNCLSGFEWTPGSDDEVFVMSPSAIVGMSLDVPPASAMNLHYGMVIREIGT